MASGHTEFPRSAKADEKPREPHRYTFAGYLRRSAATRL